MALLLSLFLLFIIPSSTAQPSPGYSPTSKFRTVNFYRGFRNLWGPQHQTVEQNALTIWLDRNTGLSQQGSGFKSKVPFRSGYFGSSIKLQPGYTAGVITAFYLSNNEAHPGYHDEVDIEFLGTTPGKPYTLQTNVYIRGSGDGKIIGREMKFHLWFDPTANFHNYAILWSPKGDHVSEVSHSRTDQLRKNPSGSVSIVLNWCTFYTYLSCLAIKDTKFFVDDIPIRRYPRKSVNTFPLRPMWLYGSIWDASSWATEDGRYKANYQYQPFVGRYTNFKASGCSAYAPAYCHPVSASPFRSGGLSKQQYAAMRWAQTHYLVYNYCRDYKRDHSVTPECWK
ncbi:hypothetical protein IFM89_012170 [Coptis chinensis]|uniref:Xyloglucan endotransglucosylase/hydrolase n=1 Tax=Coptis chinensis TaxID=261450 RepID=A0A835H9Z9_9MAGN|nr:hypothetical protein IFM89_012170 [Coptis chinensis]